MVISRGPNSVTRAGWQAGLLILGLLLSSWGSMRELLAQTGGPSPPGGLEFSLLMDVMQKRGFLPHLQPFGKRIQRIHIETQDVFTADDPFPDWMNHLHRTTRESVVRREMLVREGEPFDLALIAESERNLRATLLFSVVLIVPVRSDLPGAVDLLVFTKDLLSLRFEHAFRSTGLSFDFIQTSLTERNIAGLGKEGRLRFGLDRGSWRIGQLYLDRRLLGTRWLLYEHADILFPREGGGPSPEGISGQLVIARPLATTATRWGGELQLSLDSRVVRRFVREELEVWEPEQLPARYRHRLLSANGMVLRSFGTRWKTDIGLGYGVRGYQYRSLATADDQPAYEDWLRMPRSEQAAYVLGRVAHYRNDHQVVRNLETFELSEDVRLGHSLELFVRQATPWLGFSKDWLELDGAVGYNALFSDGRLVQFSATARSRREHGRQLNNRIGLTIKNYSQLTRWGRLIYRGSGEFGWDDQQHSYATIGGDNSLRGYLAGSRVGRNVIRQNLELRSRPWEYQTILLGWVLFWDGGDAFDELEELDWRNSVGGGLRILLPQANRQVIRADIGIPLSSRETGVTGWLSLSFGQAF